MKPDDDTEIVMTAEAVRAMGIDRVPRASTDEAMSKVEKLAVAGVAAPVLRAMPEAARKRPMGRLGKDGKVTGFTTLGEVVESQFIKRGIELAVEDGTRPKEVMCRLCSDEVKVPRTGNIPTLCNACRDLECTDCHKDLPGIGHTLKTLRKVRCGPCETKRRRKPRASCGKCNAELTYTDRPSAKARRVGAPTICRKCTNEANGQRRRKPRANCFSCGVELGKHAMTPFNVAKRNGAPPRCKPCLLMAQAKERKSKAKPCATCTDCGVKLGRQAMAKKNIALRNGAPPRCLACHLKNTHANRKPGVP